MNKFWFGASILVIIALALIGFQNGINLGLEDDRDQITVRDLETECENDQNSESLVSLQGRQIFFNGNFRENGTTAKLDYGYTQSEDEIVFNILSEGVGAPSDFVNDCRVSVNYEANTQRLEKGIYTVIVQHNGEEAERQIIDVE